MSALLKSTSIDAITLFTEDLERSKSFYQDVFGLPVHFEDENSAVFKLDNTVINLLRIRRPAILSARERSPAPRLVHASSSRSVSMTWMRCARNWAGAEWNC